MTGAARTALIDIGTSRQGALPRAGVTGAQMAEMSRLGLIGPQGGLTRKGSIMRDRLIEAALDEAF